MPYSIVFAALMGNMYALGQSNWISAEKQHLNEINKASVI